MEILDNINDSIVDLNERISEKRSCFYMDNQKYVLLAILIITVTIFMLAIAYESYLSHDVAYYITAAQMMIDGAIPYVDIIDTNLPMIIYLSALPALVTKFFNIPLATSGILYMFFLTVLLSVITLKTISYILPDMSYEEKIFSYIILFSISLLVYKETHFGQREHLIILFLVPFLVMRHARAHTIKIPFILSLIISVFAFCAIVIKPFYILCLIIFESVYFIHDRRRIKTLMKVETTVFCIIGVLFLSHFFFIPGMSSFYTRWLNFVIRGYSAFNRSYYDMFNDLVQSTYFYYYFFIVSFLCILGFRKKETLFLLISAMGWFSIMACIIVFWQQKGFEYHYVPMWCSLMVGLYFYILSLKRYMTRLSPYYNSILLIISFLICCFYCFTYVHTPQKLFYSKPFYFYKTSLTKIIEQETNKNDSVLVLNTSVPPAFPALTYSGRKHAGRFLFTYPLAFFFSNTNKYTPDDGWVEDETWFYESLLEDIRIHKPKLIVIKSEKSLQAIHWDFSLPEYLKIKNFYSTISHDYNKFVSNDNDEFTQKFDIFKRKIVCNSEAEKKTINNPDLSH